MFIAGNLLYALAVLVDALIWGYIIVLFARVLISWVNADPYNPLVRFLVGITEPVLRPIRRWLPFAGIGIDLSPAVLMLVLYFLQVFLVRTLIQLAFRWQ
jgi:YggT family protein